MAELDDSRSLAKGRGEPDLQDDILDSQQPMGLEAEERTQAEQQQLEQLDVLEGLRQLQSADPITWKVYRYGHEEAKFNGYLGQLQTTSLTQDYLRNKFGGGQYRVRGTFSGGRYAAQRNVTIAGESILYVPKEINGAVTVQPNSAAPGFNMSEYLAVQQSMDEKRREADDRRRREDDERSERRSKETRDFIVAIGGVVAPVITALVQKQAAPVSAVIAPAGESPVSSMKGMLELMTMMKTFIVPDTGGGSELAEIINAVTPIAGPAFAAFTQAKAAQQAAPVQPIQHPRRVDPTKAPSKPAPVTIEAVPVTSPIPKTAQPVPGEQPTVLQASTSSQNTGVDLSAPSQPLTSEQQSMFAQLKPQVDTLVQLARDGQDAVAVGEMFYDQFLINAEDAMYDQLCELFEDPATIDRIALFNKGVNEFRPWFMTLQEAIIKKIKQEAAQATIENPQAIDGEGDIA